MSAGAGFDESAWLRRLRGGNEPPENVFSEIFFAYFPRVRRFLEQRGASREDAEDLAQETFFRVFRHLKTFRGEASLATWLLTVARNVELEKHRRGNALKRGPATVSLDEERDGDAAAASPLATPPPAHPQLQLLTKEMEQRAARALHGLPEQMRRCFVLRFDQELRYREIAAVMQISIETVKSHIHQARARLKATLAAEDL